MKLYIIKRYNKDVYKVIYPRVFPLTDIPLVKSKVKDRKYNFIWIR